MTGVSLVWDMSGEDTGAGLGALWETSSPPFRVSLEKAGSPAEASQSANSRGSG